MYYQNLTISRLPSDFSGLFIFTECQGSCHDRLPADWSAKCRPCPVTGLRYKIATTLAEGKKLFMAITRGLQASLYSRIERNPVRILGESVRVQNDNAPMGGIRICYASCSNPQRKGLNSSLWSKDQPC